MPKTIGDLTLNEIKEIKDKCRKYKTCSDCRVKDKLCYIVCTLNIYICDDILLDYEIEEEENAKTRHRENQA